MHSVLGRDSSARVFSPLIAAIARRIARAAWSVYTHKADFDPKHVALALT